MREGLPGMERLTISLPGSLARDMEKLTKEFRISKSEMARRAFEQFIYQCRRKKLLQAAETMAEEYRSDPELTVLTDLDGEEFK
ncbi:MAG TPA: hypothetical protein PLU95_03550 [Syntrophales bacterium]|nr:hypothetical protein [Syntrophales bacterium]HPX81659.1 hypothetical protein [Syntrophales bacterium]HQK79847.1 hypothetical protein [Syntrophales bacterium]